jgi:hypothetical protein
LSCFEPFKTTFKKEKYDSMVINNYNEPTKVMHPKLLDGFNYESKGEDNRRRRSYVVLPGLQHFQGKRACWSSKMGTRNVTTPL